MTEKPGRVDSRRPVPVRFLVRVWGPSRVWGLSRLPALRSWWHAARPVRGLAAAIGSRANPGWRFPVATCIALGFLACAWRDPDLPHPDLAELWRDYKALPEHRALAIAGDYRRDRWVAGASGRHASSQDAKTEALRECEKRRVERRFRAACLLYAVGDEVVWTGP